MDDKKTIYGSKPRHSGSAPKASVKTITMGKDDHVVMSPQEFAQFRQEFSRMQQTVHALENELRQVKSTLRSQQNEITQLRNHRPNNAPWSGGPR